MSEKEFILNLEKLPDYKKKILKEKLEYNRTQILTILQMQSHAQDSHQKFMRDTNAWARSIMSTVKEKILRNALSNGNKKFDEYWSLKIKSRSFKAIMMALESEE